MPDATASQEGAPAENGTADGAAAEHSAAPAAESADAATPMETETKGGAEVVKKKRTRKHAVPYRAQGVAGLSDKSVQVSLKLAHVRVTTSLSAGPGLCMVGQMHNRHPHAAGLGPLVVHVMMMIQKGHCAAAA